ncbi:GATA zinc finger domain-containing protein 7 isoform X2 [Microplitis demolitor]|uniref:GATA zinc finger domain-containing protein 7 isoform X2 n=1 Tax=Microplitis demolitor TaxID=69319 RepID=UPI0004CD3039|nr:GATA zinc finger domain-containing protein 7 isoform X2 [Microplitis demolitor]
MTPGVNDGPRNTGTLPKSNRRNDRNREIINSNQPSVRTIYQTQHSNNLLDFQPVANDRDTGRSTKNSNTRSTSSVASLSYQDFADIVSLSGTRQYNYTGEDCIQWQEMAQSVDLRAQSPPHQQPAKPMNVDKMPDRNQVESRLNQIRDYIRMTSTMMESLSLSSDPRAHTQHDKLAIMVEDLRDSERKLSKLLEEYRPIEEFKAQPLQCSNQIKRFSELLDILSCQERILVTNNNRRNGDGADGEESLESQLRKKMEASQRKLAELQEHQANLVGMQQQVRERLQEARQTQQALLLQENNQATTGSSTPAYDAVNSQRQLANDAQVLESETLALRGKLAALQNKKKQMDLLVAELQNVEMSDRASSSSGGSRKPKQDKAVELETLKQQLAHLKNLMAEATRARDGYNAINEPEVDSSLNTGCCNENGETVEDEADAALSSCNSFDHNSEADDTYAKYSNSKERLTVEQIQAVTREMKEQQVLLQAARAELQLLKNSTLTPTQNGPSLLSHSSTPSASVAGVYPADKNSSNNNNNNNNNNSNTNHNNMNGEISQSKKRQLEELVRKEQTLTSNINRDVTPADWSSRRGSNSQYSHTSTPANIWPNSNAIGQVNQQNGGDILAPDNLLDIGPPVTAVDSFGNNWWNVPAPPINPQQHGTGSVEYYRQLLMSSQAQQLQMMNTTMQQCCQLLWAQQRELQLMTSSITQIQQHLQLNQNQSQPPRVSNETRENYSNLSRSTHHLGNVLDAALPPSSSLPNLVSLPTPSSAPSHNSIVTSANSYHHQHQHQHHNHQQLNNQVPPGNRANNYWDNFRSYSRQNLLSGNSKSVTDSLAGTSGNSNTSTNTVAAVHASHVRDKRNREHGVDNISLHSLSSTEAQYSLNLQLSSNLQTQDRETPARNYNSYNDVTTQPVDNFWEDTNSSFRSMPDSNDDNYLLRHISSEIRDILSSLVASNRTRPDYLVIILREIKAISNDDRLRPKLLRSLRALQDTQSTDNPLNETTDQTASESCQSSDEDSDVGAGANAGAQARPLLNSNNDHQSSLLNEFLMPTHAAGQVPHAQNMPGLLVDHFDFEQAAAQLNEINTFPPSILAPGYNEDLAEADQSRPEASNNQQNSPEDESVEIPETGDMHLANLNIVTLEADREIANLI